MGKKSLASTIRRLKALNKDWPADVMLFANSGTLELVDSKSFRIIKSFVGISCDGGDPGSFTKDDGAEYLAIETSRHSRSKR